MDAINDLRKIIKETKPIFNTMWIQNMYLVVYQVEKLNISGNVILDNISQSRNKHKDQGRYGDYKYNESIKSNCTRKGNGTYIFNGISYYSEFLNLLKNKSIFLEELRLNIVKGTISKSQYNLFQELLMPNVKQKLIETISEVNVIKELIKKVKNDRYSNGESEHHLNFKIFIANNPNSIGLSSSIAKGSLEYVLPSLDKIDVVFKNANTFIGIEVKSKISNEADILRGLFQCVKYKHLIEAEQKVNEKLPDSRVILVLEGGLPEVLFGAKNILGIEVIEEVKQN